MEQNNSATGSQEAGLVGVSRILNGGGYNDQGFTVAAGGADAAGSGGVAGGGADAAAGAGGVAVGGRVSVAGGVAGGDAGAAGGGAAAAGASAPAVAGGAAAAVAGPSSQSARGKKRGNHCHTMQQINAMEAYFNENPHPDKSQKSELARSLGMDHAQVKYWFQNKRAQVKSQREREENEVLRSENDVLGAQNQQYIEALSKNSAERNRLRLENIRIREQTELLKSILARFIVGENLNLQNLLIKFQDTQNPSTSQNLQNLSSTFHNSQNLPMTIQNQQNLPILSQNPQNLAVIPVQNPQNLPIISKNPQDLPMISQNAQNVPIVSEVDNGNPYPADIGLGYASTSNTSSGEGINLISAIPTSDESRQSLIELVVSAAEELKVMAVTAEPLWISSSADGATSVLNEEEYLAKFPNNFGPLRLGYTCEASRHVARVLLNPTQLLNILMNVNKWAVMFSAILSRAMTLEVLSEGVDYNEALQVIAAEYHIPTPLVPNRNAYFARYCTQHSEGVWAVVDVSVDNILPTSKIMTCQKKPSGCLIQQMADGTSKITWIEHVYVDYNGVSTMYKRLLLSGLGFGAKRWVSTLERQCQLLKTTTSANVPSTHDFNNLLMSSPAGRTGILKLAERLVNSYLFGITGPKTGKWTILHGNFGKDVTLMTRRVMDDPGLPNGTLLGVATSFRLSLAPSMVFEFFCDHKSRKKWDIFADGNDYEPVFHISYGEEAGNCVSVYKFPMGRQGNMFVLQESWNDPVASHIVFARTEIGAIDVILGGGNPDVLPLLPSGLSILPDAPSSHEEGSSGTLLTVSFQVLTNKSPAADIDLEDASILAQFLRRSCEQIKHALGAIGPNT